MPEGKVDNKQFDIDSKTKTFARLLAVSKKSSSIQELQSKRKRRIHKTMLNSF
jgi:hypothetical protein